MGVEIGNAKIDSKGRIILPPSLRDELGLQVGDMVSIEKTEKGVVLVPASKKDFVSRFKQLIETPPRRRGTPENWKPSRMKRVWKSA